MNRFLRDLKHISLLTMKTRKIVDLQLARKSSGSNDCDEAL